MPTAPPSSLPAGHVLQAPLTWQACSQCSMMSRCQLPGAYLRSICHSGPSESSSTLDLFNMAQQIQLPAACLPASSVRLLQAPQASRRHSPKLISLPQQYARIMPRILGL